jgi:predicted small integral membrane protein
MIRYTKILLAVAVALWGLAGGLGNLADYQRGEESVESVVSFRTLPEEFKADGDASAHPLLVTGGFAFIWLLKLLGGALCLYGAGRMWKMRSAAAEAFADAKKPAIAGCGVLFFMLFVGFSLVAAGVFKLYMSPMIGAVELASLFAAQIGLVMLFLAQTDQ